MYQRKSIQDVIIADEIRSSITDLDRHLPAIDLPLVLCK